MQTLYCISGLGADETVFSNLDLSFANPVFIKWIKPLPEENLSDYALRLKQKYIHEKEPLLLGLSLGGMIAVEIAKTIPGAKVIIISSAKTKDEIPFYWKMLRYMPVHKLLSSTLIQQTTGIQQFFLGANSCRNKVYTKNAIRKADLSFYKWAIGAIVSWNNKTVPSNITHIHGTGDKLLPYKFVDATVSVAEGGHLMIIENAKEISCLLKKYVVHSSESKN